MCWVRKKGCRPCGPQVTGRAPGDCRVRCDSAPPHREAASAWSCRDPSKSADDATRRCCRVVARLRLRGFLLDQRDSWRGHSTGNDNSAHPVDGSLGTCEEAFGDDDGCSAVDHLFGNSTSSSCRPRFFQRAFCLNRGVALIHGVDLQFILA